MILRSTSFCAIFSLLYLETFTMNNRETERDSLSRSSDNFIISSNASSSDSDSSSVYSSSDSDSDSLSDDSSLLIRRLDFDNDLYSSSTILSDFSPDYNKEPEKVRILCPEGNGWCEAYHTALCVYSKELDTKNSKDLEWLKEGEVFPNLLTLKTNGSELEPLAKASIGTYHRSFVERGSPLRMVTFVEITGNIKDAESLTDALSNLPNLEEIVFVNTGLSSQKMGRVANKLIDLQNLKKITLRDERLEKIPDPLLSLNVEQITIGEQTYDRKALEAERNSRDIKIVSYEDKEKLIKNAEEGDFAEIKQSIKTIDLLDFREDLLKIAVSRGKEEILKLLIDKKVNVNARYKTDEYFKDIFRKHVEKNSTLLMEAVRLKHLDMAEILTSAGADVNAESEKGITALDIALGSRQPEMIKLLVMSGANVNKKDEKGDTLLLKAVKYKPNVEVIKALLSLNGSNTETVRDPLLSAKNKRPLSNDQIDKLRNQIATDTNAKDNNGKTPLMIATEEGKYKIVKLLISHGARVDERDDEGNTALMKAIGSRETKNAKFLLDQGADPFIKNKKGETALSMAEKGLNRWGWINRIKVGLREIIEKIKSDSRYKNFEKTTPDQPEK